MAFVVSVFLTGKMEKICTRTTNDKAFKIGFRDNVIGISEISIISNVTVYKKKIKIRFFYHFDIKLNI